MKRSDRTRRFLLVQLAIVFFCTGLLVTQASATTVIFVADMPGTQEVPPNASPATGQATVTLDTPFQSLAVDVTFSGLVAPAAAAFIHCCTGPGTNPGVAAPLTGFPAATSGHYFNTFDLT